VKEDFKSECHCRILLDATYLQQIIRGEGASLFLRGRFSERYTKLLSSSAWRRTKVIFCAVLVLSSVVSELRAGIEGTIAGTVLDPSGAVVPTATVTIRNTETGIRQSTISDSKGFYSFPSLAIGRYDLEIAAPGFRPYRRTGIVIDANSALSIDARAGPRLGCRHGD
jgi:Carboxypeptidase regulatory-like domain